MPNTDAATLHGLRQRASLWRRFRNVAAPRAFLRQHRHDLDEPIRICRELFRSAARGRKSAGSGEGTDSIDLDSVPYKVLLSLEQQHERRSNALRQFARLGIDVEWEVPVKIEDVAWARIPRLYKLSPCVASHAVTLLAILDEAERMKVPSFMHLEDDVVFHPRFATLLPRLRVPRDWQFIYLGGRNGGTRTEVSPGLTRSDFIADLHAVIIRAEMIPHLRGVVLNSAAGPIHLDSRIASLHRQYPAYLCRPNLAWQSAHTDDAGKRPAYSNYYPNGAVRLGQGD